MKKKMVVAYSRRPCPQCGSRMAYLPTFLTWLFHRYARQCTNQACGYADAHLSRLKFYA